MEHQACGCITLLKVAASMASLNAYRELAIASLCVHAGEPDPRSLPYISGIIL